MSDCDRRAENSGSPDFLARARTSAYVSRAFAALRASGQAPTKMEVVDHIACYEGEAAAAKLCALYGWAFVDQDSDAFAMVKPHQKVNFPHGAVQPLHGCIYASMQPRHLVHIDGCATKAAHSVTHMRNLHAAAGDAVRGQLHQLRDHAR